MLASSFPTQPTAFGNVTRYNPKLRAFPVFNENISLAKSFNFTEDFRLDFRWEMFNVFNRHIFAVPNTNVQNPAFRAGQCHGRRRSSDAGGIEAVLVVLAIPAVTAIRVGSGLMSSCFRRPCPAAHLLHHEYLSSGPVRISEYRPT